jgi:hypothetical protein
MVFIINYSYYENFHPPSVLNIMKKNASDGFVLFNIEEILRVWNSLSLPTTCRYYIWRLPPQRSPNLISGNKSLWHSTWHVWPINFFKSNYIKFGKYLLTIGLEFFSSHILPKMSKVYLLSGNGVKFALSVYQKNDRMWVFEKKRRWAEYLAATQMK